MIDVFGGSSSAGSGFGGIGEALGGIATAIGNYAIQKKAAKASMKANAGGGGYRPMTMNWDQGKGPMGGSADRPPWLGGLAGDLLYYDAPQGAVQGPVQQLGSCGKFVASSATMRARPVSLISEVNPATGRTHWWRHVGQPILFSGDVSHCKRVGKLLGKASRKAGLRRGR